MQLFSDVEKIDRKKTDTSFIETLNVSIDTLFPINASFIDSPCYEKAVELIEKENEVDLQIEECEKKCKDILDQQEKKTKEVYETAKKFKEIIERNSGKKVSWSPEEVPLEVVDVFLDITCNLSKQIIEVYDIKNTIAEKNIKGHANFLNELCDETKNQHIDTDLVLHDYNDMHALSKIMKRRPKIDESILIIRKIIKAYDDDYCSNDVDQALKSECFECND